MYAGREFTPQNPEEREIFAFDFQRELGSGENVLTAEWRVEVVSGVDPDPQGRVVEPYVISGSKVLQMLEEGLKDVKYRIICLATTNFGQQLELYSHCRVADPDAV